MPSPNGVMREIQQEFTRVQKVTDQRVIGYLKQSMEEINRVLANSPSEFETWHLEKVKRELKQLLKDASNQAAMATGSQLKDAYELGGQLVEQPLLVTGTMAKGMMPVLNVSQLEKMSAFTTGKIKDIATELLPRMNTELSFVMTGVKNPFEAAKAIDGIANIGMNRALMITRTETGRAFSSATQTRLEDANEFIPDMQKKWKGSGKAMPRPSHAAADGQIVSVNESFSIGGIPMRFPKDPIAPIGEVVNCGCTVLPHHPSW